MVPQEGELAQELLTVKVRYKLPEADASILVEYPITQPVPVAFVQNQGERGTEFSLGLQTLDVQQAAQDVERFFKNQNTAVPEVVPDVVNRRLLFRGSGTQFALTQDELHRLGEPRHGDSRDFNFAAAVAAFGMILRDSQYRGQANLDMVLELASASKGEDLTGERQEFIDLVHRTKAILERRSEIVLIDSLQQVPQDQSQTIATVDGKYQNLLRILEVPADRGHYGAACDFGRWDGSEYAGQQDLPHGYWVYVYPRWYIWGDLAK
ncbi:MAG: DUF3520 domain-containing protein [Planctomycetes bacterium]|nr:DUF3520 domain-containing protein [Planctomycetota bacterium]